MTKTRKGHKQSSKNSRFKSTYGKASVRHENRYGQSVDVPTYHKYREYTFSKYSLRRIFKVISYLSVCKNFPKCPTKSPEKSRELMDTGS